jgi:hypothetical protein
MPNKTQTAIDSFNEIQENMKVLRLKEDANRARQCYSRVPGLTGMTMECWCRKAGQDGKDLPCPPQ